MRAPVKKLSEVHDYILMWLLANPGRPQADLAKEIGYTQSWISTIINSDMFQAKLNEVREKNLDLTVTSVGEKVRAVADLALERTLERLEVGGTENFLIQTTNLALNALGYGRGGVGAGSGDGHQRHTHIHVNAADLARAREIQESNRPVVELKGRTPQEAISNREHDLLPEFF